jgi:hypothetical protein
MAASDGITITSTGTDPGWATATPAVPRLTLAQWLVNVNEDLAIGRFSTGVELWRHIGDAERRAAAARRLELALGTMTRTA